MSRELDELLQAQLGRLAFGARKEAAVVEAALRPGEEVRAVAHAGRGMLSFVAFVTTERLLLVRAPRVLGRRSMEEVELTGLQAVRVDGARVTITARDRELQLYGVVPAAAQVAVLDALRASLGGEAAQSAAELRELARRKLGRTLAFGLQDALMALLQELEPGEEVQRLAVSSPDRVVAVTRDRVLLAHASLRSSSVRALPRAGLRVEIQGGGLALVPQAGERVDLPDLLPPERRDELAAALSA